MSAHGLRPGAGPACDDLHAATRQARAELRREMRARRDALDAQYRAAAARDVAGHVLESGLWRSAGRVFAYCATGSELGTRALLEAALGEGKALYLPRCVRRGEMRLIRVHALGELRPGRFGIPEPVGDEELLGTPDLCLAPGLAFDRAGGRLGYGGGYYDRFLAGARPAVAALAYPCQVIERVPVLEHDAPVDYIITPAGIVSCDERA